MIRMGCTIHLLLIKLSPKNQNTHIWLFVSRPQLMDGNRSLDVNDKNKGNAVTSEKDFKETVLWVFVHFC